MAQISFKKQLLSQHQSISFNGRKGHIVFLLVLLFVKYLLGSILLVVTEGQQIYNTCCFVKEKYIIHPCLTAHVAMR